MRALVCAIVALTSLIWVGPTAAAPVRVYLVNNSTVLSQPDLLNMLPALQAQVSNEFFDTWNLDATLTAADVAPDGAWSLEITDEATMAGALGYHDVCHTDGHGVPCAFVFAGTTSRAGAQVSSVISHELLEMLADPFTTMMQKVGKRFYIQEVCDAPEAEQFGYSRPGANGLPVILSDFVTPFFFRPGHVGPYDWTNSVSRPLQVLPGGYLSWWENGAWHQKFAHGRKDMT